MIFLIKINGREKVLGGLILIYSACKNLALLEYCRPVAPATFICFSTEASLSAFTHAGFYRLRLLNAPVNRNAFAVLKLNPS